MAQQHKLRSRSPSSFSTPHMPVAPSSVAPDTTTIGTDTSAGDCVTIRWDSATSIEKLSVGTQPASFGFQGQDIIDESYRKASKLDTSAFSTKFCPYDSGIIDVIGQALLPKLSGSSQGIRAELYKLNIYQAPSGMFKSHVDTPRSGLQTSSLVVCLPCAHEGGQLVVRHQGNSTIFDWSRSIRDIQWAAFYSDCEHEVLEVTSGHRITLTYNLFARRGLGELAGRNETLDAQKLPVYKVVKEVLEKPDFKAEGNGILGKHCSYAYAHATKEGASVLPSVLKGSDMVAYEVFRSLGIEVLVRPVVERISKFMYSSEYVEGDLATHSHVGNQLSAATKVDKTMEDYEPGRVYGAFPSQLMKYGNQPDSDFAYSYCALLFKILPYAERVENAKKHGNFL
ncbi:hypothetical protein CC86DRAFT_394877 [Ophiobolus disseminans]|uniref:Fe2OG dioxygenase domain-containing protein n=1 Tax=Ophiobolus disseminans TaxID=1469910 RepID=A0A6A6ZX82_9PLEO|nr:hypothetical protein CC86DRAFT_394877 [Ophiobolus disseminans]